MVVLRDGAEAMKRWSCSAMAPKHLDDGRAPRWRTESWLLIYQRFKKAASWCEVQAAGCEQEIPLPVGTSTSGNVGAISGGSTPHGLAIKFRVDAETLASSCHSMVPRQNC